MAIVIVDGIEIEIGDDEQLNGIQVARRAGIDVPHYCWHPGLSVVASCRMCLVENGRKDPETGEIKMIPKLMPGCQTPAGDGSVFVTNSEKVQDARAMVEEDLLIRHPIDCPICDKAGECFLQDYHFKHGRDQRRADLKPFNSRRRSLGDTVTLFVDRCVMCSRCVRFCREVSGTSELMVINRGAHEEIDVFPGYPLENKLSGNVVDLCPVGALGDKQFLYQQRVWYMKKHEHVCAGCSTGCSIWIDENQDRIYRLRPRENAQINQWWMCDEGRYGWPYVHDAHRMVEPQYRERSNSSGGNEGNGEPNEPPIKLDWSTLPRQVDQHLRAAGRLAVVLSPFLTVEEAYLLGKYARQVDPEATLVTGYIPEVGEDERFPNGFTIHADKSPNRRGIEKVASGLGGTVLDWSGWLKQLEEGPGDLQAAWITAGYPVPWLEQADVDRLLQIPSLILQDLLPSPLSEQCAYVLPSAAFAEREGSFVNFNDQLQTFTWAIRPPAGVMTEGQFLWRLSGRTGLYKARHVLDDLSREIAYFELAQRPIPPGGVDLKLNQLAQA